VRSAKPFNAETPAELLVDSLVTPNNLFYVRHHLPVPSVDDAQFAVAVSCCFVLGLGLWVWGPYRWEEASRCASKTSTRWTR